MYLQLLPQVLNRFSKKVEIQPTLFTHQMVLRLMLKQSEKCSYCPNFCVCFSKIRKRFAAVQLRPSFHWGPAAPYLYTHIYIYMQMCIYKHSHSNKLFAYPKREYFTLASIETCQFRPQVILYNLSCIKPFDNTSIFLCLCKQKL